MRDRLLIAAVIAAATPVLALRGIAAPIDQAQQATAQGVPTATTYFCQVISEVRHGFEQRAEIWNQQTQRFDTYQSQQVETVIQFGASGPQNPAAFTENTLPDLVRALASAIQSDRCRLALRAAGIGILRVRNIRLVYALNDKNQHEASPSVDVTFTHRDTYIDTLPAVTATEVVIFRV